MRSITIVSQVLTLIPLEAILPISVTLGLITSGLVAAWYIWPRIRNAHAREALIPLIIPHCFRYLGLSFLINGITHGPLDTRFSLPTAYGDLLTALLALISVFALRLNFRYATHLVWLFSVVGIIDFLNAFACGLTFVAPGEFGATYYIPMVVVPPLMVGHFLIVAHLLKRKPVSA